MLLLAGDVGIVADMVAARTCRADGVSVIAFNLATATRETRGDDSLAGAGGRLGGRLRRRLRAGVGEGVHAWRCRPRWSFWRVSAGGEGALLLRVGRTLGVRGRLSACAGLGSCSGPHNVEALAPFHRWRARPPLLVAGRLSSARTSVRRAAARARLLRMTWGAKKSASVFHQRRRPRRPPTAAPA